MDKTPSLRFRKWNKLKAFLLGYFWLPCPVCKKEFGGHEIEGGRGGHLQLDISTGKITCPECPGSWVYDSNGKIIKSPSNSDRLDYLIK